MEETVNCNYLKRLIGNSNFVIFKDTRTQILQLKKQS